MCKNLEKMRDSLWKGVDEGIGAHLVNCERVGKPMSIRSREFKIS